jgi:hypothetical protein
MLRSLLILCLVFASPGLAQQYRAAAMSSPTQHDGRDCGIVTRLAWRLDCRSGAARFGRRPAWFTSPLPRRHTVVTGGKGAEVVPLRQKRGMK